MINLKNSIMLLATVLVTSGILALMTPSIHINAQAQMYDNQYGYDNNYYQDDNRNSYDNNHPKKSSHTDIQKISCVNSNINVNGIDITKIPQDDTATVAANEGGPEGANTQNGNGLGDRINFDKNLVNICVNVNVNNQTKVSPPAETPPEETATLNVTKTVTCNDIRDSGLSVQQEINPCAVLNATITEDQFNITVTGNSPIPSQFQGSEGGQNVVLGAGGYTVTETPAASVQMDIDDIESQDGFRIGGPVATFSPDCTQDDDFNATGSIAAGESETCDIVNTFVVGEAPASCDACFETTNNGGPLSPGLLKKLNDYLAANPVDVGEFTGIVTNVQGLCDEIERQDEANTPATRDQIEDILNDAFPGNSNPNEIEEILDCLEGLELIIAEDS